MTKKQTAVEWIVSKLSITFQTMYIEEIEQAKQIEKEQIIDAVDYGCSDWGSGKDSEKYYNDEYGK